jgi:Putative Flp pilus-assembly TadE/G-like
MQKTLLSRQRLHERGQTILLVAVSLVSLLGMAALAIDIVTLYVARSEIQRAADVAALVGAKAVADSGITTLLLTDPNFGTVQAWAQTSAFNQIDAIVPKNLVAGTPPQVLAKTVDWTRQGNPHVTVSLRQTGLPTFFSKVWAQTAATVKASATAEAYNPANVQNFTPIAPKAVKPWLVANADPNNGGTPFINASTGAIQSGNPGDQFYLKSDCQTTDFSTCSSPTEPLTDNPPRIKNSFGHIAVEYVPALVTAPGSPNPNVCPSTCTGASDYEQSIECADVTTSYQVLSCGGGANNAQWNSGVNPGGLGGLSDLGAECLIHANGTGIDGQDILDNLGPWPASPMKIVGGSNSPQNGNPVTTSNSVVAIPIIDTPPGGIPPTGGNVTIDGYIQAFVNEVHGGGNPNRKGDILITVLNIAGCSNSSTNSGTTPVVGGSGTSPVPVRLITPP